MNSVTITVPWLPMLIGAAAIIGFLMCRVAYRSAIRRERERNRVKNIARKVCEANQRAAEADELLRKLSLFPAPWDQAYKKCCAIEGNPESRIWLKKWLTDFGSLPSISIEAITELACQLTVEHQSRWTECLDILAPYVDVGCSTYVVDSIRNHGELGHMT